jgi:type IV pilus assembly protein PilE
MLLTMNPANRRTTGGFTLIELMMTIVVLGILIAVALPGYRNYVLKANRAVAKGKLLELGTRQEQYFGDNKIYSNTLDVFLGLGTTNARVDANYNWVPVASTDGIYQLSVVTAAVGGVNHMAYTLTATPVNSQGDDSGKCATLTLTNTGQRGATGSLGMDCWD